MDEAGGDDRHVEGMAAILPLLDWKSLYVYDCIVDELKVRLLSASSKPICCGFC